MITVKQLKKGVWREIGVFKQETQSLDKKYSPHLKNGLNVAYMKQISTDS